MKHIYLLTESDVSSAYGRGTYIQQLKKCFENDKTVSLNIVHFFANNEEFSTSMEDNVRTFFFPFQKITPALASKYYRSCWHVLKSYITLNDNEQIIFHLNFLQEYELVLFIKEDIPSAKIFFTLHFQQWSTALLGNVSYYKKIISDNNPRKERIENEIYSYYLAEKRVFKNVDQIICLSEFTKELLINTYKLPADKIRLIYNGLQNDFTILTKKEKENLKNELYIPVQEEVLLFVGRLEQSKGLDILINSFKKVVESYQNCKLIIIGDGDFSKYFKEIKGYRNKIIFTGKLDKNELYTYYQIADIGIIPSFHEQCSYVAIEMMGFGIPIISSSASGLCEMIKEYKGGTIVDISGSENKMTNTSYILFQEILSSLKAKKNIKAKMPDIFKLEKMRKEYQILYNY